MSAAGLGDKNGVLVVQVSGNGESQHARLETNDVIRAVNGQIVLGLNQFADLWKEQTSAGSVKLKIWRNQAELNVVVPTQ